MAGIKDSTDQVEDQVDYTEADEFEAFRSLLVGGKDEEVDSDEEESEDSKSAPVDPDEHDEDEESDDADESDEDEDSEKEDGEDEEDETEDDDVEEQDEEVAEEGTPVEVDFDTVITLPNGVEVSIEELSNGYKSTTELTEAQKAFEAERQAFEDNSKDLAAKLDLAKLEAQRVLDDFEDFDWTKLAQEDPQEFANTKLFVEKYATRAREIEKAQADLKAQRENEEQLALDARARQCVKTLEADLPEWNENLYQRVITHAVELGMSQEAALNLTDAGVIKALVNSLKMESGKNVIKAKITKKVKGPEKVVKPGGKKPSPTKAKANYSNEAEEFKFFSQFID